MNLALKTNGTVHRPRLSSRKPSNPQARVGKKQIIDWLRSDSLDLDEKRLIKLTLQMDRKRVNGQVVRRMVDSKGGKLGSDGREYLLNVVSELELYQDKM